MKFILAMTVTLSRLIACDTGNPSAPRATGQNPLGLMLPSQRVRSPGGVQVAKTLGAIYYRLYEWKGTCPECEITLKTGWKFVLTVRNTGRGQATSSPRDLVAYQRTLPQVLDTYRPAVLVVENEENSALFYTGTPQQYAAQLKAACRVAHQKGIPCTNGGPVSLLVARLVYDHYLESGQTMAAQGFAARAFTPQEQRLLHSSKAQEQMRKGKALLASYCAACVGYVNFHWYIADTRALEEAMAFLKTQTGLPVLINEIGQHSDSPQPDDGDDGQGGGIRTAHRGVVQRGCAEGAGTGQPGWQSGAHRPGVPAPYRVHVRTIAIAADGLTCASSRCCLRRSNQRMELMALRTTAPPPLH